VSENVADEDLVALVIDHDDQPIFIATDIENYLVTDEIGSRVG
jgi:hypothetical protein